MTKNSWPTDAASQVEASYESSLRSAFLSSSKGECVTFDKKCSLSAGLLAVADVVAANLNPPGVVQGWLPNECYIMSDEAFVTVEIEREHDYDLEIEIMSKVRSFKISITAHRDVAKRLHAVIHRSFQEKEFTKVEWWYRGSNGEARTRTCHLPPLQTRLHPEYYPDMGDPQKYLSDYLASDAPLLLLAGEPGTGKTTLLRHMIHEHHLETHVVYDEQLMARENLFQTFLFGKADILIIEDADTLLSARDLTDNKLMARFLNISDGLIKLPNKKMVFTTNVSDFGRIDAALLRPGRCFGVVHTRALNLEEAQAAAKVANVPIPMKRGEYTLAQLFNQGTGTVNVRRVGFGPTG